MKCIGSDADNIRPAQRALQFFKNPKILALLIPAGANSGSADDAKDSDADATSDSSRRVSVDAQLHREVGDRVLGALLPALFRGGSVSWNPTVNKMTALALKGIKASSSRTYPLCCLI